MALLNISRYNVGGPSPFGSLLEGMGQGLQEKKQLELARKQEQQAELARRDKLRADMIDDRAKLLQMVSGAKSVGEVDFAVHTARYFKKLYGDIGWDIDEGTLRKIWEEGPQAYAIKQRGILEERAAAEHEAHIGQTKASTAASRALAQQRSTPAVPKLRDTMKEVKSLLSKMDISPANWVMAIAQAEKVARLNPGISGATAIQQASRLMPEVFQSVERDDGGSFGTVFDEEEPEGGDDGASETMYDQAPGASEQQYQQNELDGQLYEKRPDGKWYPVTRGVTHSPNAAGGR